MVQAEASISSFLIPSAASGPARPMQCFDITTYLQNREVEQPWLKKTFQTLKKVLQSSRCCGRPCVTTCGLGSFIKQALLEVSMKHFFVRPLNLLFLVHRTQGQSVRTLCFTYHLKYTRGFEYASDKGLLCNLNLNASWQGSSSCPAAFNGSPLSPW